MGRRERLFYEFCLEDRVPANHFLRKIDAIPPPQPMTA